MAVEISIHVKGPNHRPQGIDENPDTRSFFFASTLDLLS